MWPWGCWLGPRFSGYVTEDTSGTQIEFVLSHVNGRKTINCTLECVPLDTLSHLAGTKCPRRGRHYSQRFTKTALLCVFFFSWFGNVSISRRMEIINETSRGRGVVVENARSRAKFIAWDDQTGPSLIAAGDIAGEYRSALIVVPLAATVCQRGPFNRRQFAPFRPFNGLSN